MSVFSDLLLSVTQKNTYPIAPTSAETRVLNRTNATDNATLHSAANTSTATTAPSPYGAVSRLRREINVNLLLDVSGSMPQSALDYLQSTGIGVIFKILENHMGLDYHYNVRLCTFASDIVEIMPFTPLEQAINHPLPVMHAHGVTRTEDALRDAISAIKTQKDHQNAQHAPRGSSICVVITDGCPTDEHGIVRAFDSTLAQEIAGLNKSRSIITYAVGMGDVNNDVLRQIGPADMVKLEDGSNMPFAHAVLYPDKDYSDRSTWENICQLVGNASSSVCTNTGALTHEIPTGMAYNDENVPDAFRKAAFVDPGTNVQLIY